MAPSYKGKHPIQYLRDFVGWKFPEGKIIETVVGAVPVSGMLPKLSTSGLVLVGDAGHVSDPITGGGIINAMTSGRIAGNVIAESIKDGDMSAKALTQYDKLVREELGKSLDKNYKIKEVVTRVNDNTMDLVAHSLMASSWRTSPSRSSSRRSSSGTRAC